MTSNILDETTKNRVIYLINLIGLIGRQANCHTIVTYLKSLTFFTLFTDTQRHTILVVVCLLNFKDKCSIVKKLRRKEYKHLLLKFIVDKCYEADHIKHMHKDNCFRKYRLFISNSPGYSLINDDGVIDSSLLYNLCVLTQIAHENNYAVRYLLSINRAVVSKPVEVASIINRCLSFALQFDTNGDNDSPQRRSSSHMLKLMIKNGVTVLLENFLLNEIFCPVLDIPSSLKNIDYVYCLMRIVTQKCSVNESIDEIHNLKTANRIQCLLEKSIELNTID